MSVSDNKATLEKSPARIWHDLYQLRHVREVNVLVAMLIVGALISLWTPYFLTTNNLMGVFRAFSLTAIMSIGMVMVIVTGGIDLSVGSAMGLASLVTALCFGAGYSTGASIGAGVAVGIVFGLSNGLLITAIGLPPFIATLGTLSIGRGMMYMVTHGVPVTPETPDAFSLLGQGYVGPVPVPVVIMLILMVLFALVMKRTRFGRHVYATGGNEQAARLSGVKTNRVKLAVYMLSSTIASLAGIIGFSRYLTAEPASGFGSELDVIAAAAIGGASLAGGVGSVTGAVIGAALVGVIANGVVLLNINTYAQQAITGGVILIAVSLDVLRNKLTGGNG
ncbi:MAG: ABC transporter permease [Mesorhizobium sp.]|uniref:ABC transporter permease n=1 Tax=Mesorhizobium sp. M1E.F.Ca.ET.045.02.1.1 TaxID=2493672 RepID=UPI000F7564B4|nr:ABC transporter permease [Mesorhizobium sp. M1E.F.Ca.ET.045.02.1.1]AZO19803.1 ABC transporter permease [Mesorhizobium sp. M1E.F.Ca.ET.045.02.1.1]TIU28308.1 MAG: ABC transporter permease [Mesorhizobium sp.]TKB16454.1 MAG: ABC transporter permease [Mesorhizobium sp.]